MTYKFDIGQKVVIDDGFRIGVISGTVTHRYIVPRRITGKHVTRYIVNLSETFGGGIVERDYIEENLAVY